MAKYQNLVLVATVYVADGWYGKRYRYILSGDGEGFQTKSEARKFATRLKRLVVKNRYVDKIKSKDILISCDELDTFIEYTHVSNGPSLSYDHRHKTIEDLPE